MTENFALHRMTRHLSGCVLSTGLLVLFALSGIKAAYSQQHYTTSKSNFEVAIFAPMYLDSLFTGQELRPMNYIPKYALAGLDFIQGAQIALDSLELHGKRVQAFIYDSKSASQSVASLIRSGKLNDMDLIIGSVKQPEYAQLAQFSMQKNIPFVSATYPNDGGIRHNRDLIIVNPTLKAHCQAVFSYLLQKHGADNIYLIRQKSDSRIENYFKEINSSEGKPFLKIRTIMIDSSLTSNQLRYLIDTTKTSVVIGASLDETFSTKLADACYPIQRTNPMFFYGMPNWDGFSAWYRKGAYTGFPVYFTSPHYIVKANGSDVYLNDRYMELYRIQPSDMAEKGFETTFYFTSLLLKRGKDFLQQLNDTTLAPLHNFNFQPVSLLGDRSYDYFENKHLFMLQILNGEIRREP